MSAFVRVGAIVRIGAFVKIGVFVRIGAFVTVRAWARGNEIGAVSIRLVSGGRFRFKYLLQDVVG
jgi:hypothetical protein